MVAPKVSAESSITNNLCLFAICLIFFQSGRLPIKLGIKSAFVLLVILDSILFISICKVSISQSTKIGIRFDKVIEEIAVPKFRQGTIISLPFLKSITLSAKIKADEPELTIKPNFFANNLEILFSKSFTDLPI